jgi:D-tyrosyl-tRNA(Tyr) deacylase
MRAVVQRVSRASVRVGGMTVAEIGHGLLVLIGVSCADTERSAGDMARKIATLRIFPDDSGRMNRALAEMDRVGNSILSVSQFTLYGDVRKGRRPSFIDAAPPEVAKPIYEAFLDALRERGLCVVTDIFGALMEVDLVNDGPGQSSLIPNAYSRRPQDALIQPYQNRQRVFSLQGSGRIPDQGKSEIMRLCRF